METLVMMGAGVAGASGWWQFSEGSELVCPLTGLTAFLDFLYGITAVILLMVRTLDLEKALDNAGDWRGVWKLGLISSLLNIVRFRSSLENSA